MKLKRLIKVARGLEPPDLVLKGGQIVNVFSNEIYPADIALQLAAMLVVFLLIGLVGSTNPRLRIDQAVRYYAVLIVLSLAAVALAVKGW